MHLRSATLRSVRRAGLVGLAAVTAATLAANSAQAATFVRPARWHKPPKPDLGASVTGGPAAQRVLARPLVMPALAATAQSPMVVPGSYTLTLTAAATGAARVATPTTGVSWHPVGSSGITVTAPAAPANQLAGAPRPPSAASAAVSAVGVTVLDQAATGRLGVTGLAMSLKRADGASGAGPVSVRIPHAVTDARFGADYAARLRWVLMPAAGARSSRDLITLPATQDHTNAATVVTPQVSAKPMVLAAVAGPVGANGTGTFAATPLKPSSSWQVTAQTGDFSWSYPLTTPPAAAGPSPSLALSYDSGSIDGETGSTNNQPSAIGEGWSLAGTGFVERKYVSCSEDTGPTGAVTSSGDLCWKTDNAVMSFGGHSGNLVKDASGTWKLQDDDGSRIEHLTTCVNHTASNDCWRLTTVDGTQYYFGLNELPGWTAGHTETNSAWSVPVFGNDPGEPGYNGIGGKAGTFATEATTQAWRWNLDYVVDPHGNAESLFYTNETNHYAQNGTGASLYDRGGELKEINYGQRSDAIFTANSPSSQVEFSYAERCTTGSTCSSATPTSMPDVPWDQTCAAAPCTGKLSPTFWSELMLTQAHTTVRSAATVYSTVDTWNLNHAYFNPGDTTSAALSLTQITRTASTVSIAGTSGTTGPATITLPPVKFSAQANDNRVWDTVSGLAHLAKFRIYQITTETGASTTVAYQPTDPACTYNYGQTTLAAHPDSDTHACFQQWWTPSITPPQPVRQDLFYKYLVSQVDEDPGTGGLTDQRIETQYLYTGTPAWRYDNSPLTAPKYRTWSDWAGYSAVQIRKGSTSTPSAQQVTDYTFYQGMDGDHMAGGAANRSASITVDGTTVTDSRWLAGRTRDTRTANPADAGTPLADVLATPWASPVTATDGTLQARIVEDGDTRTTVPTWTGATRATGVDNTYDPQTGLITSSSDNTPDAGSICTRTSYAQNKTGWLLDYPSEISVVGQPCSTAATLPDDAISDERTSYDSAAWGTAPTTGNPTLTQQVLSYTGATPRWVGTATRAFDALGRITSTTDQLGRLDTTSYTPATGGPLTSISTTTDKGTTAANLNWTSTTAYNPARQTEITLTDKNSHVTSATYDALGRRGQVWLPTRPIASYASAPSISYAYTVSQTAPSTIATTTLTSSGSTITSYALYDGLGRPRQTQSWSESTLSGRGHTTAGTVVTDTFYDSAGRPTLTNTPYSVPTINPSTTLFSPQTTVPGGVRTDYDAAGRKTAEVQLVRGKELWRTSYTYQGADRTNMLPPDGGTPTATFLNSRGKTSTLWQYNSADFTATPLATSYHYNPRGDMTSMTDATGRNQWSWTFDTLGRQTSATDPDTGTTTTAFDDSGRVSSTTSAARKTDATNPAAPVTLAYTYDHADRKTKEYLGSTAGALRASWTYDGTSKGLVSSATRYVGSDAFTTATTYDAADRPATTTVTIPTDPALTGSLAGTYSHSTAYNVNGSLSYTTDGAEGGLPQETLRNWYTSLGNEYYHAGYSAYLANVTFTGDNHISQENLTDGNSELDRTFYYAEGTNRLTRLLATTSASTNFLTADHTYTYNNAGAITEDHGTSNAGTDIQCFGYDHLQQLTAAWTPTADSCTPPSAAAGIGGVAPYWTSYSYDNATGNRTAATTHNLTGGTDTTDSSTYPAAGAAQPHLPSSISHTGIPASSAYAADAAGDTITRPGQSLAYTAEGQLATATTSGGDIESNIYDADGTLLLKTDPAMGNSLYLGDTELHTPPGQPAGTVTGVRTYTALGTPVAERATTAGGPVNGTVSWLNADRNNTVTDEAEHLTLATTHRYSDPFGNPRGTTTPAWTSNHTYLNQPADTTTATVHLGARDYDPTLGRFLSRDPIVNPADPQQANGYTYSSNNPVNLSDPTGLMQACNGPCHGIDDSPGPGPGAPRTGIVPPPGGGNGSTYVPPPGSGPAPGNAPSQSTQSHHKKSSSLNAAGRLLNKVSTATAGLAVVGDVVAVGCAAAAPADGIAPSALCEAVDMPVVFGLSTVSSTADLADMLVGGKDFSGVDFTMDLLSGATFGGTTAVRQIIDHEYQAKHALKVVGEVGNWQTVKAGLTFTSLPYDVFSAGKAFFGH